MIDARFDTMTAAPGADQVSAAAMALDAELLPSTAMALGAEPPPAAICVVPAAKGRARTTG